MPILSDVNEMSYTNSHIRRPVTISFSDLTRFLVDYYHHNTGPGLHLGGAFCDRFEVRDIFLEFNTNDEQAIEEIITNYVRTKQYA